jgi:hypothetical protein
MSRKLNRGAVGISGGVLNTVSHTGISSVSGTVCRAAAGGRPKIDTLEIAPPRFCGFLAPAAKGCQHV